MKKLIVARHGSYSIETKTLDSEGELQILVLRESLSPLLQDSTSLILFSPAPRAKRSAEILAEIGLPMIEVAELLSRFKPEYMPERAFAKLQEHQNAADNIILMTHFEYAEMFPNFVGKDILGIEVPVKKMSTGTAVLIDLEAKSFSYLP